MPKANNCPGTRTPCALQDYLHKDETHNSHTKLTDRECQMAFQNWVAYGRTSSPAVRPKEHLTCPLLWCRHRFDSLASCLQHVSVCPWLSNGYYWCPQCQRAERFTPNDLTSDAFSSTVTDKKCSKLKRAVTFFKHFGRKSLIHGHHTESRASSPTRHAAVSQGHSRRFSIREPVYADGAELETLLDSTLTDCAKDHHTTVDMGDFDFQFDLGERPYTLYDMEGNALSPFLDAVVSKSDMPELASTDPLFTSSQLGDTSVFPYFDDSQFSEHNGPPQRLPTHYGPFTMSFYLNEPEDSMEPAALDESTSAELEDWEIPTSITPMDVCIENPISTCGALSTREETFKGSDEMASVIRADGLSSFEASEGAAQNASETNQKGEFADKIDEDSQIRHLRGLVCGLHNHWLQKLRSTPEFPFVKSTICGLTPFEAGMRSLQQCFSGSPPSSMEGVLSLMHFAFASACTLQHDPLARSWHDLFDDVLEWRKNIEAQEDRSLYVKIVCLLWAPRERSFVLQGSSSREDSELSPRSLAQVASIHNGEVNGTMSDGDTETGLARDESSLFAIPDSPISNNESTDTFSSNAVMKSCSQYLNVLEHARILSRSKQYLNSLSTPAVPSSANIERVKTLILQPLLQWHGIEAFSQSLINTSDMLCRGFLQNIHDVEVMLTTMACDTPSGIYDDFCHFVGVLCDNAMQQDPSWRNRYYATLIDHVLAISTEQENEKRRSLKPPGKRPPPIDTALANSGPKNPSLTLSSSSTNKPSCELRGSLTSTSNSDAFESPVSVYSSSSSRYNSGTWTTPSTSPETSAFAIAPSPISPCTPGQGALAAKPLSVISPCAPSPTTTSNTAVCQRCGATFTGAPQHRSSNLKRHERTMHRRRSKLMCSEVGCGVEFSRSDNLRKHRKTAHGIEEPLRRPSRGKFRRPSDLKEITSWI